MLINRDKYFENRLLKKKRKYLLLIYFPIILCAILFVVSMLEYYYISSYYIYNIPEEVAKYMLKTIIFDFNIKEFQNICIKNLVSIEKRNLLIFIYYSSNIFFLISLPVILVFFIGIQLKLRDNILFINIMKLYKYIESLPLRKKRNVTLKILLKIYSIDLIKELSPLKDKWMKDYNYLWFKKGSIIKDNKKILYAFKTFEKKIIYCIRRYQDVEYIKEAINYLANYTYIIELKKENNLKEMEKDCDKDEANNNLKEFATIINKIIVKKEKEESKKKKIFKKFKNIFDFIEDLKLLIPIGIVSAIIAFIGYIFFGITKSAAFIIWFTVVFGSATISIGITKIKSKS